MSIYTFSTNDGYWHDQNSYSEIGELHTDKDFAIVGKLNSRYSANKKKSILSPDSDRLLYNYFSDPDVKDCALVKETTLVDEKYVFVGKYFISIYDTRTGNFVCENPKSFLKDLINPISSNGLGYETDENGNQLNLSANDFDSICANMKYAIAEGEWVYIISMLENGTYVLFRVNPSTYAVESIHAEGFMNDIGSKMIYCKPFTISSKIYFLLYNEELSALECYYFDTYSTSSETAIFGYSSGNPKEEVSVPKIMVDNLLDNFNNSPKIENAIVALSDEKRNGGTVYFFSTSGNAKVYTSTEMKFTSSSTLFWPTLSSSDYFKQYSLFNDNDTEMEAPNSSDESDTNTNAYILLLTNSGTLISRTTSTTTITGGYRTVSGGKIASFFRSVLKTKNNDKGYEYLVNLVCNKNDGSMIIHPIRASQLSQAASVDISSDTSKNAIIETYSGKLNISGNIFKASGANLIIGNYYEDGRYRPLIKDIGNEYGLFPENDYLNDTTDYPTKQTNAKTFRKGLEPENGVSIVKNIAFGNTRITRVRMVPESANDSNTVIQYGDANIFMRETDSAEGDYSDGAFTTGSLLWKILAKTGIPYNTQVQTVGRIIMDGKDIPIENVMITPAESDLGYGSTLLTIDKNFDINYVSDNFTKNGKALYPGILFQASANFLNDAMISNVYNVDGSFAYNDIYRGELFNSNDVGYFDITASCLVTYNDNQYLLIATNFGKLASINIKTGGYTKFDGSNIGEHAPGFSVNLTQDMWTTHGDICRIEQFGNKVYLFYATGYIYRAYVSSPAFTELTASEHKFTSNYGKTGINRVSARYGNTIVFATNIGSSSQIIEAFDLLTEKNSYSYTGNPDTIANTSGDGSSVIKVKDCIYFGSNGILVFNTVSHTSTKLGNMSSVVREFAYDGNDRIYFITSGKEFGYININDFSVVSLPSVSYDYYGDFKIIGNTGNIISAKFNGYNGTFNTNTGWAYATASNSASYTTRTSITDDYLTYTKSGEAISITNIRTSETNQAKTLYKDFGNDGKYITAIGFANSGRELIISFIDGGIGSIDIPSGKYYNPDYEETYTVTKCVPYNITPSIKKKSISYNIAPEYSIYFYPHTVTATKNEKSTSAITMNTNSFTEAIDNIGGLITAYENKNGTPVLDGYVFDHWENQNGDTVDKSTTTSITNGIDYEFTAVFVNTTSTLSEMLPTGDKLNEVVATIKSENHIGNNYGFEYWASNTSGDKLTSEKLNTKYEYGSTATIYVGISRQWQILNEIIPETPSNVTEGSNEYSFDHWSLTENGDAISGDELTVENKYMVGTQYMVYAVMIDKSETVKTQIDAIGKPTLDGYTFDHWSATEDGTPLTEDDYEDEVINEGESITIYAIFYDTYEPYVNRSMSRIFAKAGEFLDEGACTITNVGNDVILSAPTKSVRWAEDIGVFFKGRDDKFTGKYVESIDGIRNSSPIVPMPLCDSGICSIGKYIIYINGYNKFAELPTLTVHNGVVVYDTEYDEYAVMYTGVNNLHGTRRAKIKSFCYAYDNCIYEFGGLERIDEHVGADNYSVLRRTAKIEEIDLVTGKIREFNSTYGLPNPILEYENNGVNSSSSTITAARYSDTGKNEMRFLQRIGNTLKGVINLGGDPSSITDVNGTTSNYYKYFVFDLVTKQVTMTDVSSSDIAKFTNDCLVFYSKDGTLHEVAKGNMVIPLPKTLETPMCDHDKLSGLIISCSDGNISGISESGSELRYSDFTDNNGFKLDPEVIGNSDAKLYPAVELSDGSIFVSGNSYQNKNNNSEDSLVYTGITFAEVPNYETAEYTITVPTGTTLKSCEVINDSLFVITSDGSTVTVSTKEISTNTVSNTATLKLDSKITAMKTVICSDVIAIITDIGLITFDAINFTLKLRETIGEQFVLDTNAIFRFDSYFKSLVYSNANKIYRVHEVTNESHSENKPLNISKLFDCVGSPSVIDYVFSDTKMTVHEVSADNIISTTLTLDDSGEPVSKVSVKINKKSTIVTPVKNSGNYAFFNKRFGDDSQKTVEMTDSSIIISSYDNQVVKYNCGFNADRLDDSHNYHYVANDGKYMYYASDAFTRIAKTSIFTGYTEFFDIDNSVSNGVNSVRDIAAVDEIVYFTDSDGSVFKFDTVTVSLDKIESIVSSTLDTTSLKMCSNANEKFVYIVKPGRIYRLNTLTNATKLYENIDYAGDLVNVRYIADIDELRFVSVELNFETNAKSKIHLYRYNFASGELLEIGSIERNITHVDYSNICNGKYITPIHLDDDGNVYIFGNPETNSTDEISVIDGNTLKEFKFASSNTFKSDILIDVSISNDFVYLVTKRTTSDTEVYLTKCDKPFNYIKASKKSLASNNALASNRVFVYNGETYVYGFTGNNHVILKYNEDTNKLIQFSNGSILDSSTEFDDANVLGINVFIDGIVYIIGMAITGASDKVKIVSVGYNLKTKSVCSSTYAIVTVPGASAETLNVIASSQGNWSSHFFTTVLHAEGSTTGTVLTMDIYKQKVSTSSMIKVTNSVDSESALSIGGALAVIDGKVISVGGTTASGSKFGKIGSEYSAIHNITGDYNESYDADFDTAATMIKCGTHLKLVDKNGIINIGKHGATAFDAKRFDCNLLKHNADAFDVKSGDSNYVIPCEDNTVLVGNAKIYDNAEDFNMETNSRVYKIPMSSAFGFEKNGFGIRVFDGVTTDLLVSTDLKSGKIIDSLKVAKDYGVSIDAVHDIDDNRSAIIYSGAPCAGTLFIHDNGKISLKRYDGSIFGQAIDTGTNIHSIQEVDFTVLFDEEQSESEFRTVEGLNAD